MHSRIENRFRAFYLEIRTCELLVVMCHHVNQIHYLDIAHSQNEMLNWT